MDKEYKVIRIIAVLTIIGAVLPPYQSNFGNWYTWYTLAIQILSLVAGIGLFKFKRWAYYLYIVIICGGVSYGIIDLNIKLIRKSFTYAYPINLVFIGLGNLFSVLILLLSGLLIFYLMRPKVKEKFKIKSMNKNIIISLPIIVLIILSGFIFYQYQQFTTSNQNINTKQSRGVTGNPSSNQNSLVDYSKEITGRFILKDSTQAGFNFIGNRKVLWQNELNTPADELAIYWLDGKTFVTKDIQRIIETSSPRVSIYIVNKFDGKNLELKELWTGWGDYKFGTLNFVKSGI